MRESESVSASPSNFRGDKNVTKKNRVVDERISFRDLAKLACRRKTEQFLSERTGFDPRTCKRWLSRRGNVKAPDRALGVVLGEIMRRAYG